jgi:hypothetical protein
MKTKNKQKVETAPPQPQVIVTGSTFNGVVWDKASLDVIALVARGLVNLTELFKSQHVQIDALMSIGNKQIEIGKPKDFKNEL